MDHPPDIHSIADQLISAQNHARQIEPITSRFKNFDIHSAYSVARLIHEKKLRDGAVSVGRKIGFTNPAMWERYNVNEPIWAHIYDTTVVHLSANRKDISLNRFTEPKIEPEIVFHFRSAPPAHGGISEIIECIDWISHGFEIVQSHFPGWKFQAPDTVADSCLHGILLVGEPIGFKELGKDLISILENLSVYLFCNGSISEIGKGSNVLGNPLSAVAHLLEVLARQPDSQSIQAGEIVTTGTITTARSIHAGETWWTELDGIQLPGLLVHFVS